MIVNDFSMFGGDTRLIEVTVLDDDGIVVSLVNVDKIRWWLSKTVSRTSLVMKSIGSGIEVIDAPNGRFNITIDSTDTEDLRHGNYYHESEVIIINGQQIITSTVFSGTCTILATLIKPESP